MQKIKVELSGSWMNLLQKEMKKSYFKKLIRLLDKEYTSKSVYPPADQIFNAFHQTPFEKVKVVLLGQDPYHGPGQAHGLCFSVPEGIRLPHSLINIFKEIQADLSLPVPSCGNLESWARQGVLLLNTTLTVRSGDPMSHHGLGWKTFTDKVIHILSENKTGLVFLLWGKHAQSKEPLINTSKHFILKAAHPSPFSARNGFFGCRHFSKTNELLIQQGQSGINWCL